MIIANVLTLESVHSYKNGLPRAKRPRNDSTLEGLTPSHCEEQHLKFAAKQSTKSALIEYRKRIPSP